MVRLNKIISFWWTCDLRHVRTKILHSEFVHICEGAAAAMPLADWILTAFRHVLARFLQDGKQRRHRAAGYCKTATAVCWHNLTWSDRILAGDVRMKDVKICQVKLPIFLTNLSTYSHGWTWSMSSNWTILNYIELMCISMSEQSETIVTACHSDSHHKARGPPKRIWRISDTARSAFSMIPGPAWWDIRGIEDLTATAWTESEQKVTSPGDNSCVVVCEYIYIYILNIQLTRH